MVQDAARRRASRSSSTSSTTTPPRATTSARRCRFKGIDNPAYYRLDPTTTRATTSTTRAPGNTLNMRHPHVLQLIMDSLRYWVHRDARRRVPLRPRRRRSPASCTTSTGCRAFFDLIQQDPVVSQVKLIAEPWDVGEGGYQVGNFPPLWSEWNGKYRDTVRDFWRGADAHARRLRLPLHRLADLYEPTGARPYASINFVTAHDGFTLADLVSYNEKHNDANGEDNRDGTTDNRSWNCGVAALEAAGSSWRSWRAGGQRGTWPSACS